MTVRIHSFHSAQSLCSPSRSGLIRQIARRLSCSRKWAFTCTGSLVGSGSGSDAKRQPSKVESSPSGRASAVRGTQQHFVTRCRIFGSWEKKPYLSQRRVETWLPLFTVVSISTMSQMWGGLVSVARSEASSSAKELNCIRNVFTSAAPEIGCGSLWPEDTPSFVRAMRAGSLAPSSHCHSSTLRTHVRKRATSPFRKTSSNSLKIFFALERSKACGMKVHLLAPSSVRREARMILPLNADFMSQPKTPMNGAASSG
mmetsp:Transcript_5339/g.17191  ORF Transcript_5339/g.17191 Transcript_5339/m.17191 type:complete len:257 (-) Transcript_5339:202-972(-)